MATLLAGGGVLTSRPLDRQGAHREPCPDPYRGSRRRLLDRRGGPPARMPGKLPIVGNCTPGCRYGARRTWLVIVRLKRAEQTCCAIQTSFAPEPSSGFAWNREPMASNTRKRPSSDGQPLGAASNATNARQTNRPGLSRSTTDWVSRSLSRLANYVGTRPETEPAFFASQHSLRQARRLMRTVRARRHSSPASGLAVDAGERGQG